MRDLLSKRYDDGLGLKHLERNFYLVDPGAFHQYVESNSPDNKQNFLKRVGMNELNIRSIFRLVNIERSYSWLKIRIKNKASFFALDTLRWYESELLQCLKKRRSFFIKLDGKEDT